MNRIDRIMTPVSCLSCLSCPRNCNDRAFVKPKLFLFTMLPIQVGRHTDRTKQLSFKTAVASPCASWCNSFGAVFAKMRTRLREVCSEAVNLRRCRHRSGEADQLRAFGWSNFSIEASDRADLRYGELYSVSVCRWARVVSNGCLKQSDNRVVPDSCTIAPEFAAQRGVCSAENASWAWLPLLTAQNLAERVEIARHLWQN